VNFWDQLEAIQARHDVLKHPFYLRWSAGELSDGELAHYAGEYRHAVVALADASAQAGPEVAGHAAEEASHVALWDGFARAVGADLERQPLPETRACARAWRGEPDRPLTESLVALYAIESAQPEISSTKLAGLRDHYGIDEPDAVAYFELHMERDVEHAAAGRAMIDQRLDGADHERLLSSAENVLRANWELLDGVNRAQR
jgi:pyrroloquinoline-quinone synthase